MEVPPNAVVHRAPPPGPPRTGGGPTETTIPRFFCAERVVGPLDRHAGSVLRTFETDTTGRNAYRINSWGFRGQDWSERALRRVFVFGCSYTFGTGLQEDELWCAHVLRTYAEVQGVPVDAVNLLNFGVTGASNAEIARLAAMQCSVVKPDLALVMFTHPDRTERVLPEGILNLGPWSPDATYLSPALRELAGDFYRIYNEDDGALDLARHLYFTQRAMVAAKIDCLTAAAVLPRRFPAPARRMLRLLDRRRTVWLPAEFRRKIARNEYQWTGEKASDELHFGPGIHRVAGEVIADHYRAVAGDARDGSPRAGKRI